MGSSRQFESHGNELHAIYGYEYDPEVIEYYDQPNPIKLNYADATGRNIGCIHTPDLFLLWGNRAGWVECKPEEKLQALSKEMPNRYVRQKDGSWRCPPGEAYAARFGLTYTVRSSSENDPILTRNFIFLEDYFRRDYPKPSDSLLTSLISVIRENQGLSYTSLLTAVKGLNRDDLNFLISRGSVYVDLKKCLLLDPDHVSIFTDYVIAQSIVAAKASEATPTSIDVALVDLTPTAKVNILDQEHIITSVSETVISLLTPDGQFKHLKRSDFDQMILCGKVHGKAPADSRQKKLLELILGASHERSAEALRRWHAIQRYVENEGARSIKKPKSRTLRRWIAAYRAAQQLYGCGFVGIIPESSKGNSNAKLSPEVVKLIDEYIQTVYETPENPTATHVHGKLMLDCAEKGLTAPSLNTFLKYIKARPQDEQTRKTKGSRAETLRKKFIFFLDSNTPAHGDRPFEIGHIDHTELDIELICSRTGKNLGRPWLTILIDAFSRRILAISLSFFPPSSEACMRVLRNCVKRHNRLPQIIVVDNGKEFNGVYFEVLLAAYTISKKSRPPGKPRFGSVCERIFGTINKQFIHTLIGNTQLTKSVRMLTKSVDPARRAAWTIEELTELLAKYCFDVYDVLQHPSLGQTPNEAYTQGMELSGHRKHTLIPYDALFQVLTMPTTKSGVAKVHHQKGIHINFLDYWCDAFLDPKIAGKMVPVRFDPWDMAIAYAFVNNQWCECISSRAYNYKRISIRSVQSAAEELRRTNSQHAKKRTITARQLAEFMKTVADREDILKERARESGSQASYRILQNEEPPPAAGSPPDNVTPFQPVYNQPAADVSTADNDDSIDLCPVSEE